MGKVDSSSRLDFLTFDDLSLGSAAFLILILMPMPPLGLVRTSLLYASFDVVSSEPGGC